MEPIIQLLLFAYTHLYFLFFEQQSAPCRLWWIAGIAIFEQWNGIVTLFTKYFTTDDFKCRGTPD